MAGGPRYRAVLLDFRGILVHDPDGDWWIAESLRRLGRSASDTERVEMVASLDTISSLPSYAADERRVDTSLAANREIMLRWLTSVGIDRELAEELWQLDCEPVAWPVFPDVADVVRAIHARGCATALVSDFHVDLRPHLAAHGIELDAYVISFEHGFQKPDPRMFTTALDLLGVGPREALMVGDRASHDGGAAAVGIDTLILPAPSVFGSRDLDVVLGLLR